MTVSSLTLMMGSALLALPSQPVAAKVEQQRCSITEDESGFAFSAEIETKIRALLDDMVEKGVAPGVVIMIEHRGDRLLSYSSGYADAERNAPMKKDALFRIFSMTKPITSVAAMQLIEEDKMSLDDPVSKFLSDLTNVKVWTGNKDGLKTELLERPVLIKDLLRHTAGFTYRGGKGDPVRDLYNSRGVPAGPGFNAKPTDGSATVTSLPMMVERISEIPLLNQPGAAFTYGNASDVLGRVVEVVSRRSLSDYFAKRIFEPLSLKDTMFEVPANRIGDLSSAYAAKSQLPEGSSVLASIEISDLKPAATIRIDDGQNSIYAHKPAIEFGGAGLVSTASDYLRFTQAMRQGGQLDGNQILLKDSVNLMMQDHLSENARASSAFLDQLGFGYGFAVRKAPTSVSPVFPQCGTFWGGAASTNFWIDRSGETSGVLMTQVFGGDVRSYWMEILEILYSNSSVNVANKPIIDD